MRKVNYIVLLVGNCNYLNVYVLCFIVQNNFIIVVLPFNVADRNDNGNCDKITKIHIPFKRIYRRNIIGNINFKGNRYS